MSETAGLKISWPVRLLELICFPLVHLFKMANSFISHSTRQTDSFLYDIPYNHRSITRAEKPPAFRHFTKLPAELRTQIWTHASHNTPRVVPIHQPPSNPTLSSHASIPGLLHACQESRMVAKQFYTLSFATLSMPDKDKPSIEIQAEPDDKIWVNWFIDIIYIPSNIMRLLTLVRNSEPRPMMIPALDEIRRLAVVEDGVWIFQVVGLRGFPILRELVVVKGHGMREGVGVGGRRLGLEIGEMGVDEEAEARRRWGSIWDCGLRIRRGVREG